MSLSCCSWLGSVTEARGGRISRLVDLSAVEALVLEVASTMEDDERRRL